MGLTVCACVWGLPVGLTVCVWGGYLWGVPVGVTCGANCVCVGGGVTCGGYLWG